LVPSLHWVVGEAAVALALQELGWQVLLEVEEGQMEVWRCPLVVKVLLGRAMLAAEEVLLHYEQQGEAAALELLGCP
jgi:hypothetical protein